MQEHTMTFDVELTVDVQYDVDPGDKSVGVPPGVENVRASINCNGVYYPCPGWLIDLLVKNHVDEMVKGVN